MVVGVIAVVLLTILLNGGINTPSSDNQTNNTTTVEPTTETYTTLIGNNSMGQVVRQTFGNTESDTRVAIILYDPDGGSGQTVIDTFKEAVDLNYAYDVYTVTLNSNSQNTDNTTNNLTDQQKATQLASQYAVDQIKSNNYNFTIDIRSSDGSSSYVYVPADGTSTSQKIVNIITNSSLGISDYTPDNTSYTTNVTKSIINSSMPAIVYATSGYNVEGTSVEISNFINVIDGIDFSNPQVVSDNSTQNNVTNLVSNGSNTSVNLTVNSTANNTTNTTTNNSSSNTTANNSTNQ